MSGRATRGSGIIHSRTRASLEMRSPRDRTHEIVRRKDSDQAAAVDDEGRTDVKRRHLLGRLAEGLPWLREKVRRH